MPITCSQLELTKVDLLIATALYEETWFVVAGYYYTCWLDIT